jgi:N6-adenosine-specific RNA methylase IME4
VSSLNEIPIDAIQITGRYRKDYGDIAGLAASIEQLGLLQPIGVNASNELVFGHRRLLAFRELGRTTIPARMIDVPALVMAEHAENEIRKDFTVSERVEIGRAVEQELGKRQGRRTDLGSDQSELVANLPEVIPVESGKTTREVAAEKAGFDSTTTYRNAKTVVEKAAPELVTAMDSGAIAVSTAAKLAVAPVVVQQQAVADPKKAVELAKQASAIKTKEIKATAKEERKVAVEEKKQERIADIEQQSAAIVESAPAIPIGPFHVISIDPPWPYGTPYDPHGRRAANPYPEMSLEAIKAIELPAADDCVLWLWTTHKFMRHSFELLDTWGFRDVAILTWVKDRMGLGSWLRSQSEFCIMAVKGKPPIQLTNQTTIIDGPLREHSRKPDSFYELVNGLCVGAKLDYFSREKREGWAQVGNTTELFGEVAE